MPASAAAANTSAPSVKGESSQLSTRSRASSLPSARHSTRDDASTAASTLAPITSLAAARTRGSRAKVVSRRIDRERTAVGPRRRRQQHLEPARRRADVRRTARRRAPTRAAPRSSRSRRRADRPPPWRTWQRRRRRRLHLRRSRPHDLEIHRHAVQRAAQLVRRAPRHALQRVEPQRLGRRRGHASRSSRVLRCHRPPLVFARSIAQLGVIRRGRHRHRFASDRGGELPARRRTWRRSAPFRRSPAA